MQTDPSRPSRQRFRPPAHSPASAPVARVALVVVTTLVLAACGTPSPSEPGSAPASVSLSPSVAPTAGSVAPTPTPEPPLSLATPAKRDARHVRYSMSANVPSSGVGQLTLHVTNLSKARIPEIVLRWPTALDKTVFLAPFQPSPGRLTTLLVQPWTRWVIGPGEQGEPAGTTSLGWGPLLPGATLDIPLFATRRAAGPVSFDLQFLAGEAILTLASGGIAETRVTIR